MEFGKVLKGYYLCGEIRPERFVDQVKNIYIVDCGFDAGIRHGRKEWL